MIRRKRGDKLVPQSPIMSKSRVNFAIDFQKRSFLSRPPSTPARVPISWRGWRRLWKLMGLPLPLPINSGRGIVPESVVDIYGILADLVIDAGMERNRLVKLSLV
ncbi:hypothetical protein AVEN_8624-1 [Araneus ventricosus]|uniref:Uncharacterized protein n=1 Tax=Araneus ventricosus TaxID=182803 RepID=A0A4Y2C3P5_ARAVE|nr:hypothetical protein AVEN_8624-1 [Araneus ventricosus]